MPRMVRIQHPGALYHVINRGNYKSDIFASEGARRAFLKALIEAVKRHGWKLHAYVIMRNHYHLAMETPQPNLVEGMQWLQGTFANRFNRMRNQRGHLFQGRYKAILLEDESVLCRVVDYIHLNPVRAKVVTPALIINYAHSSLGEFLKRKRKPGLTCAVWLKLRGWDDTPGGVRQYVDYLTDMGKDEDAQKKAGLVKVSSGWAMGTQGWKQALAREYANQTYVEGMPRSEIAEIKETHWNALLSTALKRVGKNKSDLKTKPRMQAWKKNLLVELRKKAGIPIGWLAEHLQLGTPSYVRNCLSKAKANE